MSLASNKMESSIDYRDVNTTFNERFKWAKYTSNYSEPYTTYKWNRYTYTSRTWYCWDYYDGGIFMGSCRHGNSCFHINSSYEASCGTPLRMLIRIVAILGSYYYVYQSSTTTPGYYYKGNHVEDVKSTKEDAYPTDGRHSDGFWYVKIP